MPAFRAWDLASLVIAAEPMQCTPEVSEFTPWGVNLHQRGTGNEMRRESGQQVPTPFLLTMNSVKAQSLSGAGLWTFCVAELKDLLSHQLCVFTAHPWSVSILIRSAFIASHPSLPHFPLPSFSLRLDFTRKIKHQHLLSALGSVFYGPRTKIAWFKHFLRY